VTRRSTFNQDHCYGGTHARTVQIERLADLVREPATKENERRSACAPSFEVSLRGRSSAHHPDSRTGVAPAIAAEIRARGWIVGAIALHASRGIGGAGLITC
jgi:hypothetical protein